MSNDRATIAALGDSLDTLRVLINATPDIICFKDGEGRWLEANDADLALFDLLGVDYRGKTDRELAEDSPAYRDSFLTCMVTDEDAWHAGGLSRAEETICKPDGTSRTFDCIKIPVFNADGSRRGLVVIGRDITEQKAAEEGLRQAQRLEAIGRLAGGVAHDFNNQLTVVTASLHLARRAIEQGRDAMAELAMAEEAVERSTALTAQLLAFAREERPRVEPIEVDSLVRDSCAFLGRLLGDGIDLDVQSHVAAPVHIEGDRRQLEQVLMNLALNSRDAMAGRGRLGIDLSADERAIHLTVTDTGCGMTPETVRRLFDPFFSTKGEKGTGLGMAIVKRVLDSLDGAIDVASTPGEGTRIRLSFPRSERSPQPPPRAEGAVGTRAGRILLVEDDAAVRQSLAQLLTDHGHEVAAAANATEALAVVDQPGRAFDLVLTDVSMPGMTGPELGRALQERRPSLPVLYMAGHAPSAVPPHELLDKPVAPEVLLRRVSELLGARGWRESPSTARRSGAGR